MVRLLDGDLSDEDDELLAEKLQSASSHVRLDSP